MIPKHYGGWWTIYYLSVPHGSSINDSLNPEQYSLAYCSVDDAFAIVSTLGKGALMAKINQKCILPYPCEARGLELAYCYKV